MSLVVALPTSLTLLVLDGLIDGFDDEGIRLVRGSCVVMPTQAVPSS